jgi:hypothetical protein
MILAAFPAGETLGQASTAYRQVLLQITLLSSMALPADQVAADDGRTPRFSQRLESPNYSSRNYKGTKLGWKAQIA